MTHFYNFNTFLIYQDDFLKAYFQNRQGIENDDVLAVANRLGRTEVQCLNRWEYVLKLGLTKGPWTDEEDEIIKHCVIVEKIEKVYICYCCCSALCLSVTDVKPCLHH